MDQPQDSKPAMEISLAVFKEPRGVMRILQLIFSICAFATTTGFSSYVQLTIKCHNTTEPVKLDYSYPFRLDSVSQTVCGNNKFHLVGDFSSDAQFFVATGVLSFLYCIFIGIIYIAFDAVYQKNYLLPLADFVLTVILAVFWLSGSAAWANGLSGLKHTTGSIVSSRQCSIPGSISCLNDVKLGSVSELNISVILGFLNFFLWGSDLWFLYKETAWFKSKQGSSGMATTA